MNPPTKTKARKAVALVRKTKKPKCEGCAKPPTTSDIDGVPLCDECAKELWQSAIQETTNAIVMLRRFNEWRRGADEGEPDPAALGIAIETLCDFAESALNLPSPWLPIETAPKDATPVDLWVPSRKERLANYKRVERGPTNVFYDPVYAGVCCVRDATHWMPIPSKPKANQNS